MAAAGFERPDGFVNHGAMACEALAVLGCPGGIDSWARRFAAAGGASVDPVVPAGFGWRQALGDYRRPACLTRCQHRGHRPPVPRFRFRLPDAVAGNASSACSVTGLARGAAHGTGSGAGGVPAPGDRPGHGVATRVEPVRNALPAGNEHEPAAHEQTASEGIADDVAVLMGANDGQAEQPGLTRRATCHARWALHYRR